MGYSLEEYSEEIFEKYFKEKFEDFEKGIKDDNWNAYDFFRDFLRDLPQDAYKERHKDIYRIVLENVLVGLAEDDEMTISSQVKTLIHELGDYNIIPKKLVYLQDRERVTIDFDDPEALSDLE
jgi:hypothetical protein